MVKLNWQNLNVFTRWRGPTLDRFRSWIRKADLKKFKLTEIQPRTAERIGTLDIFRLWKSFKHLKLLDLWPEVMVGMFGWCVDGFGDYGIGMGKFQSQQMCRVLSHDYDETTPPKCSTSAVGEWEDNGPLLMPWQLNYFLSLPSLASILPLNQQNRIETSFDFLFCGSQFGFTAPGLRSGYADGGYLLEMEYEPTHLISAGDAAMQDRSVTICREISQIPYQGAPMPDRYLAQFGGRFQAMISTGLLYRCFFFFFFSMG